MPDHKLAGEDGLTMLNSATLLKNADGSSVANTMIGTSPIVIPATNLRAVGRPRGRSSTIAIGAGIILIVRPMVETIQDAPRRPAAKRTNTNTPEAMLLHAGRCRFLPRRLTTTITT